MTATDSTVRALMQSRPARDAGVRLGPGLWRGPAQRHVVKSGTGRKYELGPKEFFVLSHLDGVRTLAEIGDEVQARFGRALGPNGWTRLLAMLGERRLLADPRRPAAPVPAQTPSPAAPRRPNGVLSGEFVFGDPSKLLDRCATRLHRLREGPLPYLLAAALAGLEISLLIQLPRLGAHTRDLFRQQPALMLFGICLVWLSSGLHELSHGLAARFHGAGATAVGFRWLLPITYFFCRVQDVELLVPRRHRISVALAGVQANLIVLIPFTAVWYSQPDGTTRRFAGAVLALGCGQVAVNLLPIPPLDGYKILSHALNVTGLGSNSRAFVRAALVARRRRTPLTPAYPRRLAVLYASYLLLAVVGATALAAAVLAQMLIRMPQPLGRLLALGLLFGYVCRWFGLRLRRRRSAAPDGGTHSAALPEPVRLSDADLHAFASALRSGNREEPMATGTPGTGPAVVVENLTKDYGPLRALDAVSFTVERGELFGVLGPNGAGKTTLIEIMEGLRPAGSGRVQVLGHEPWPRNFDLLPLIGVQTQASAFFTRLTALEHLQTVAALYGVPRPHAADLLEKVGLADRARARVEDLSGGQRQRLALACALVHGPELLFLDEPTAALDPQARRDLWALMRQIRDAGKTVVYTTHHLDEAEALCDRVAIISHGRLAAVDRPDSLVSAMDQDVQVLVPAGRLAVGDALRIEGVQAAADDGSLLVLTTRDPGRVLSAVTELAGPRGVRTRSATLEDVYLRLTGSEFHP